MLNMYSDHYRLTANHVDGARGRRFRIRAKGLPKKRNTTSKPTDEPKDAQVLLVLLQESCAEAERVAGTTRLERDYRLAMAARRRFEEFRNRIEGPVNRA